MEKLSNICISLVMAVTRNNTHYLLTIHPNRLSKINIILQYNNKRYNIRNFHTVFFKMTHYIVLVAGKHFFNNIYSNFEANTSELLENLVEMYSW